MIGIAAFMEFIFDRLKHKVSTSFAIDDLVVKFPNTKNPDGSLQIMSAIFYFVELFDLIILILSRPQVHYSR